MLERQRKWPHVLTSRVLPQAWAQLHITYLVLVVHYKHLCVCIAQSVKNLPAMQETWVRFLGQEDPLEKEMATHSSVLAWKIP